MAHSNLFQNWDTDSSRAEDHRPYELPQSQNIPPDLANIQLQSLDANTSSFPSTNSLYGNCGYFVGDRVSLESSHQSESPQVINSSSGDFQQSFGSYGNQYSEFGGHGVFGEDGGYQNHHQFNELLSSNSLTQTQDDYRFASQRPIESYSYEPRVSEQSFSALGNTTAAELLQPANANASTPFLASSGNLDQQRHAELSVTASGKPRKRRPKTNLQKMTEEERRAHEREINRPAQARHRSKKAQQQRDLALQLERKTVRNEDLHAQLQLINSQMQQFTMADANF